MRQVEINDFSALIDNAPIFDQLGKINKKRMENFCQCQEMMTEQQETY